MGKTIFTRTYFGKGDSTLMGHEDLACARKWMAEGIRNGALSAVAWTGAQDRADEYVLTMEASKREAA
jgi:hypothetical protein